MFNPGPRAGQFLATVASVNDLHFGETVCGMLDGLDVGPVLRSEEGDDPYPAVMNRAAVAEISSLDPAAVVVKGDITSTGSAREHGEFLATYGAAFGERLVVTLGNHDKPANGGELPPCPPLQFVDVDGATLAVLDTARPGQPGGEVSEDQVEALDELAARADRPLLVFGHHPVGGEDIYRLFGGTPSYANCLDRDSTQRLVTVVSRRPSIVAYFAGHTHRNKVRHLPATDEFPWVEVACVKDFPGSWAEYRVLEGAIVQVHHRISSDPDALRWSERCRAMFAGKYPLYALGQESDRCFEIPLRADGARRRPA